MFYNRVKFLLLLLLLMNSETSKLSPLLAFVYYRKFDLDF